MNESEAIEPIDLGDRGVILAVRLERLRVSSTRPGEMVMSTEYVAPVGDAVVCCRSFDPGVALRDFRVGLIWELDRLRGVAGERAPGEASPIGAGGARWTGD